MLDGFGTFVVPPPTARPVPTDFSGSATADHPPGFYGPPEGLLAVNALTANDRPYKLTKKLSECLDIMMRMSRGGHLDPDLFTLFLTSGTYRRYADKFCLPDQLDEVSVASYLPN